jgi:hypothetical protein
MFVHEDLVFFLMLITTGPCVFNCMSRFISQRLHSFIQIATQNHVPPTGKMLLSCQPVWDHNAVKRLQEHTANFWQQTMDTFLSGILGCSLYWDPLFCPSFCWLLDLIFFKYFLALFSRGYRLSSRTLHKHRSIWSYSCKKGTAILW